MPDKNNQNTHVSPSPACPGVALCEAGCLLPKPPIQPIQPRIHGRLSRFPLSLCSSLPFLPLVLLSLVLFHPWCLCVFVATTQLCKTNPIPKTQKPPQPLMPERLTAIYSYPHAQKNKPKQTQFIAAKPAWGGAKPEQTQLVAAQPLAKPDSPRYAIRNTTSACPLADVRNTKYASRFTRYDIRSVCRT